MLIGACHQVPTVVIVEVAKSYGDQGRDRGGVSERLLSPSKSDSVFRIMGSPPT